MRTEEPKNQAAMLYIDSPRSQLYYFGTWPTVALWSELTRSQPPPRFPSVGHGSEYCRAQEESED